MKYALPIILFSNLYAQFPQSISAVEHKLNEQLVAALSRPEAQWKLEELALLIAKEEYPSMQLEPFRQAIQELATKLSESLKKAGSAQQRLEALASLLFEREKFQLPLRDDADAFLLGSVLKNKRGNCLGLSVLCLALAERTGLALHGVPIPSRSTGPGHLLVRYDDGTSRINFDPTEGGKAHPDNYYLELFKLRPQDTKDGYILNNVTCREIVNLLLVNLGGARVEAGQAALALPLLEKAVQLKPDYAPGFNNLGAARLETNDLIGSREAYLRAKQLDGESLAPRLGLARIALSEGKLDEAEDELSLVLAAEPENTAAQGLEANLHLARGNPQGAVRMLQRIAEETKNDPKAWNNLGAANLSAGLFPASEEAYRKALAVDPRNVDAHYGLGEALRAIGKVQPAMSSFQQALKLQSDHVQTRLVLAELARNAKHYSEAAEHYRAILNNQPYELQALSGYSQLLLEQKKAVEAEQLIQRALTKHPQHPGLQMLYGEARMGSGDLRGAIAIFQKILSDEPERYRVAVLQRLSACHGKSGDHRKALELAQQLLQINPSDLTALRLVASAFEGLRNASNAIATYKKILFLQPGDSQAEAALKRLGSR